MHILLLAQHYAPEEVSGAALATQLATGLVERGHRVTFVTSAPNYPRGRVFPGYRNRLYQVEVMDGVRVVRTWSYISERKSFWRRIFNYGTFSATALYGGLLAGRPDVMLSYSPPLPLGVTSWMLSRRWQVPWVLRVEDLYPDSAASAGILRNRAAIHFFRFLERSLYHKATHVSLLSEGFRQNLLSKSIPAKKLSVIPVWSDPGEIVPAPRENSFREAHNLEGKFVIMYAGNLGHTSALEDVLDAAMILRREKGIHFVFAGQGVMKPALVSSAEEAALANVTFLPFQPRERLSQMMAAADLSLVTLNRRSYRTSMPSKTFSIMASERPILAVAPQESELTRVVEESGCGLSIPPGNAGQLAENILQLRASPHRLTEMGRNGRQKLLSDYSKDECVALFEEMLLSVLA